MNILQLAILIFALMEGSNILILYFKPQFQYGNSMRAFHAYEASKADPHLHLFVTYMTRWVANCKVIFIALLLVVAALGDVLLQQIAVGVTICSIGIFFVTLYPIKKQLDTADQVYPKGYAKTLSKTILSFMVMFSVALLISFYTL
ncbi:MAG: hypothetical protein ACRCZJ_07785 [Erysipelotrichaceae bacterium]